MRRRRRRRRRMTKLAKTPDHNQNTLSGGFEKRSTLCHFRLVLVAFGG